MNLEAHLATGWILANIPARTSRRFRLVLVLLAAAPDADAVSWLFGEQAYGAMHHTLGHNFLAAALFLAAATALVPGQRPAAEAVFGTVNNLCSHRLTDIGAGATYQSTFLDVEAWEKSANLAAE